MKDACALLCLVGKRYIDWTYFPQGTPSTYLYPEQVCQKVDPSEISFLEYLDADRKEYGGKKHGHQN